MQREWIGGKCRQPEGGHGGLPMRLCSYVVKTDTGLAPNPFWGYCTLALCTPNHMGVKLSAGDWIMGTTPKHRGQRLLYAMQVDERLHFDVYFTDLRFRQKRPNPAGTWRQRCGDNQYYHDKHGQWCSIPSVFHNTSADLVKDTKRPYVFIGRTFYYWGKNAIPLPECFKPLIHPRQGCSCKHDVGIVRQFAQWLTDKYHTGIHGEPADRESLPGSCRQLKSAP